MTGATCYVRSCTVLISIVQYNSKNRNNMKKRKYHNTGANGSWRPQKCVAQEKLLGLYQSVFNKYLSSISHVPGTALRAGD